VKLINTFLEGARSLLDDPPQAMIHAAPRSAAAMARNALEHAMAVHLKGLAPGSQACDFTTQLIVLQHYMADKSLARRVAWTWSALSRATHHNGYELPPPRTDLERWLETVAEFAAAAPRL